MVSVVEQLRCILSPKSIAIVGASSDYSKFTGRTVKYLLKHGYAGRFYPVNPKREEIAGHRCYPSISELPEPVDTAFIQIPARFVPSVLEECIQKQVKSIIIHSAGMGEEDAEGKKRQEALKAMARDAGIRVVGPNCAGIANMVEKTILSPIVCYELDTLTCGRIGLISQSGGLTGAYVTRAEARGIGFSHVISTGNEMDLEACDYMEYLLYDDETDVVAVFLEALRNGERFLAVAETALEAGKPIIVLKVGRTRIGARAAASHTGALTGTDAVYDAVFRQKGVVRVDTLEDLFEVSSLFCKVGPPEGNRIGVITTTGGGATLMVEAGAQAGLDFPEPSESAVRAASAFLPSFAAKSNPMDVTMAGAGDGYKQGLEVMLNDPAFDMVVGVVGTSSQFAPELGVKPIVEVHETARKPLAAFCNPNAEEVLRLFEKHGIPSFRTPEGCGRALGRLVAYGKYRERRKRISASPKQPGRKPAESGAVSGILRGSDRILNEFDGKRILAEYGIRTAREKVARDPAEAREAADRIGYPVAVKILSPDIPHKTEAGVVALGIASADAVEAACRRVLDNAERSHAGAVIDGILVQEMISGGVEVIVGMAADETFGPALMFGLGGVFVEVFQDTSHRVPPLTHADARDMIEEVRGAVLLKGYRGKTPMDVDALVDSIVNLARFCEDFEMKVAEVDINPLLVLPAGQGVVAVDALIRKK